jgi:flavin-dependent dehydrogenase
LCVGDAAATVDPLSGQGISRALLDGIMAGRTCLAMLAGDRGAAGRFHSRIVRRFAADCQTRLTYYRAEARWSDAPFWRRRHLPAPVEIAE